MDLRLKIKKALEAEMPAAQVTLNAKGGIYGYVVSNRFKGKSALARHDLIETAIKKGTVVKLTGSEAQKIMIISGYTPTEYEMVLGGTTKKKKKVLAKGRAAKRTGRYRFIG